MGRFTIILFLMVLEHSLCHKILGIFPLPAYSHFTLGFRIMHELAERGHEVTFINPYPQKHKIKNFEDVSVASNIEGMNRLKDDYYDWEKWSFLTKLNFEDKMTQFLTEETLRNENVQNLLKSNVTFDLVLMEHLTTHPLMIFAYKSKCPIILFAPEILTVTNNIHFANPLPSSYIPNLFAGFVSPMNFWKRSQNTLYNILRDVKHRFSLLPELDVVLKTYVKDAPDLSEFLYNATFMFLNSHPSFTDPIPLQFNIKDIGGYHVAKPKKLPKNIKEFMDNATEGVVLFSMGSNLRSADIPPEKLKAILEGFGGIKEKVLWKFELDELAEKPKNVKIMKWLPQNDILAHPNVKAFIGHGGILSTIETVYHGVPMIGLPVFWDQKQNMKTAAKKGYAICLPFQELGKEKFATALNYILSNPRYRENSKLSSNIMHSDPMAQMDSVIFWMEYVLKFTNSSHLESLGMKLRWYERNLTDVISVLVFILVLIMLGIVYVFKYVLLGLNRFLLNRRQIKSKKH